MPIPGFYREEIVIRNQCCSRNTEETNELVDGFLLIVYLVHDLGRFED